MSYCLVFLATVCMIQTMTATLLFWEEPFTCRHLVYNEWGEHSLNVMCCHYVYNFWLTSNVLYRLCKYARFQTPRYNGLLVIIVNPEAKSGSNATANCKNVQEQHILSITKHHVRTLCYSSVALPHKSARLVLTRKNLRSIRFGSHKILWKLVSRSISYVHIVFARSYLYMWRACHLTPPPHTHTHTHTQNKDDNCSRSNLANNMGGGGKINNRY